MNTEIFPLSLGFNDCYVIRGQGVIMIDGGMPGRKADFTRALQKIPMEPHDIKLIVITHGHPDHVGSAKDLKELTGAEIAMHRLDKQCLETGKWKETHMPKAAKGNAWGWLNEKTFLRIIAARAKFPSSEVELVIDDDGLSLENYGIPGQVIYTPGHTIGSVSVLLDSGEAFVGDLAMNKLPLRRNPGLPILAEDIEKVKESWRKLLELGATTVYPGHGKPFSVEVIKRALK
jgi:hydroxyacylglutathione hydrolase